MMRILLLLFLCIPSLAIAQQPSNRMLGLTTQDQNGLHIVVVVETPGLVQASVREFSPSQSGEARIVDYPRKVFDELWLRARELDLSAFIVTDEAQDIGASKNYVLIVGGDRGDERTTYLIPKCGVKPEVESLVMQLAHDLLPAGSPGLFEPCPPAVVDEG